MTREKSANRKLMFVTSTQKKIIRQMVGMCEKLLIFNYKRAVTQSNPWSFTVLLFKDQIKNDKGA